MTKRKVELLIVDSVSRHTEVAPRVFTVDGGDQAALMQIAIRVQADGDAPDVVAIRLPNTTGWQYIEPENYLERTNPDSNDDEDDEEERDDADQSAEEIDLLPSAVQRAMVEAGATAAVLTRNRTWMPFRVGVDGCIRTTEADPEGESDE